MVARRLLAGLVLCVCAQACADAPFERANPNDTRFDVSLTLLRSRDTVTIENRWVSVQVVSDPVLSGYEPYWTSGNGLLVSYGDGLFRLESEPAAVTPIQVQARFAGRAVSTVIYAAPSP